MAYSLGLAIPGVGSGFSSQVPGGGLAPPVLMLNPALEPLLRQSVTPGSGTSVTGGRLDPVLPVPVAEDTGIIAWLMARPLIAVAGAIGIWFLFFRKS